MLALHSRTIGFFLSAVSLILAEQALAVDYSISSSSDSWVGSSVNSDGTCSVSYRGKGLYVTRFDPPTQITTIYSGAPTEVGQFAITNGDCGFASRLQAAYNDCQATGAQTTGVCKLSFQSNILTPINGLYIYCTLPNIYLGQCDTHPHDSYKYQTAWLYTAYGTTYIY